MVEIKRVVYLLVWMLAIGLSIVYLRTLHVQAENQRVANVSQMQKLHQQIQRNHLDISYAVGSPEKLRQMLEKAGVQLNLPQQDNPIQ
ncbi:MAG: hypothetical protein JEZ07_11840 [Phycisphaerae bacterium]|nr:hypothetical protein [Phycisphaerae bacterium]